MCKGSSDSLNVTVSFPPTAEISDKIKGFIRQGDIESLKAIFKNLCAQWPLETLDERAYDFFRKKLLTGCGRVAQIAIEEGVPYHEANSLSENFFNEIESTLTMEQLRDKAFELLFEFTRRIGFYKFPKYSKNVRSMLDFIRKNIDSRLLLSDIAASVGLTPNYATALFKQETGRLLKDEIKKIRIDVALRLLATTSLAVADIAVQTGFKQSNHFSRTFKAMTGYTPNEYRNSVK